MELKERGMADFGLEFGRTDKLEDILLKVVNREGIYSDIADGTKRMAAKYGGEDFAINSKGLELASYEPRRSVGMGLGYAVANRGGCHLNGGYLALLLVSAAELMAIGQLRPRELLGIVKRQRTVWILAGIYLLFTAISALLSPYDYNIWVGMSRREGLLTQLIYIGVFLSVSAFGRLRTYHVRLFGAVMSVFCAICLLQLAGLNPLGLYPEGHNYHDAYTAYSGEYLGTIGNADLVSALLAMASALFYAAAFYEKGRARALDIALLCLTGFALFAIKVAAGILAFAVTVLAATPLMLRERRGAVWKRCAAAEAALVLLALAAVILFDFGGSGTLYELHELLHGRPDLSFGSGRLKIWSEVLTAMKGHLLLGTGPDSMQVWELPGFTRYIESLGVTIESGIDMAHNEYLNVAAQQGLLAGAAFLALLLLTPAKARPYNSSIAAS